MNNNISSTSKHIWVNTSPITAPYINSNNGIGVGNVRYYNNYLQAFDGNSWLNINSPSATAISMSPIAESAIEWATNKLIEEQENKRLAETIPAIRDLLDQIAEKNEQLKAVKILLKEQTV